MNQDRMESCHDHLKITRLPYIPEKIGDLVSFSIRVGIIICLIASISLAIHSTFAKPDRWFPLPEHLHVIQNVSVITIDTIPTNISHIVFGIAGSSKMWHSRSNYSKLWWNPTDCRGFVWFDKKPKNLKPDDKLIPYKISRGWTKFRYLHSASAVRISRIVYESFRLGLPNVRWFVMGDDDTVFFPENLVTVLGKYDHNQLYYIGGNSESVEQDAMHSYDMAFGGGGIAISYALAAKLANIMDSCLHRYYYFYGSDQRIWACVNELGVSLTRERGFHQLDIRGNPYGLLAAHPLAPLVSLHHLDQLNPVFPDQSQISSLKKLISAYDLDPARIVQQSVCYDHRRRWSISISWGYTIQIYTSLLITADLQMPFQTFKTWRSSSDGPFTFNTRWMNPDVCQQPSIFFLDQVSEARTGSVTTYKLTLGLLSESGCTQISPTMSILSISSASTLDQPLRNSIHRSERYDCIDSEDQNFIRETNQKREKASSRMGDQNQEPIDAQNPWKLQKAWIEEYRSPVSFNHEVAPELEALALWLQKEESPLQWSVALFARAVPVRKGSCCSNLFSVLSILFCNLLHMSIAIDTITSSQFIKDPETLISKDGNFTFGCFSPINSTNRYVGIWWKSRTTVVWVAKKNQSLNDSNGIVTISENGNLVVLNG